VITALTPHTLKNVDNFLNSSIRIVNNQLLNNWAICNSSTDSKEPNTLEYICQFPESEFGACSVMPDYGYSSGQPCVFIKLNKIYGWIPNVNTTFTTSPLLECKGQTATDAENLRSISYYPSFQLGSNKYGKFSHIYFPYVNQDNYIRPLVAVHFENVKQGVPVSIRCFLIGLKDIDSQSSSVSFDLTIDS